jgi:XTP/dITP diphosphohydrolase
MSRTLLVATRNAHKLQEIRELLGDLDIEVVSLTDAGISKHPAEDSLEVFNSFEENALAKARYYRSRSGIPTIADDSGLCVDALDGAPGIHSRRFAPVEFRGEQDEDVANNEWLLDRLNRIPAERRGAHYRCALALVDDGRSLLVNGSVHGRIAVEPRGTNGFGYDPLFVLAGGGRTFGELSREVKAARSHRADAIRRLRPWLA